MSEDSELQAIDQLLSALAPLEPDARERVLDYVFRRLELRAPPQSPLIGRGRADSGDGAAAVREAQTPSSPSEVIDIRTFAGEKKPASQVEKTVFVAYYLTEVAPETERKTEISGADLEKYQKLADLGAPTNTRQALFLARDAGYLESAGHGKYKLNAVGYNFVAHSLPSEPGAAKSAVRNRRKPTRKKPQRKRPATKPSRRKR